MYKLLYNVIIIIIRFSGDTLNIYGGIVISYNTVLNNLWKKSQK